MCVKSSSSSHLQSLRLCKLVTQKWDLGRYGSRIHGGEGVFLGHQPARVPSRPLPITSRCKWLVRSLTLFPTLESTPRSLDLCPTGPFRHNFNVLSIYTLVVYYVTTSHRSCCPILISIPIPHDHSYLIYWLTRYCVAPFGLDLFIFHNHACITDSLAIQPHPIECVALFDFYPHLPMITHI